MTHPFIVIEGIDGTGKSTIVPILARRLGGAVCANPPISIRPVRREFDTCANPVARFLYYLSGLAMAAVEIESLRKHTPVICERFLPSTLATHAARGIDPEKIVDIETLGLPVPTLVVLLTCEENTRLARIRARDPEDEDLLPENVILHRESDRLLRLTCPLVLDTTSLSVENIVCTILGMIPATPVQ